jgi:GNAT superfamily N-acetyltransferase
MEGFEVSDTPRSTAAVFEGYVPYGLAQTLERENAALREAATEAIAALGKALHAYPDTRAMGHAKAMLEAALGSVPARGDSVAEPQQISASDEPSPAAYYPWGIDTPQPGGGSV